MLFPLGVAERNMVCKQTCTPECLHNWSKTYFTDSGSMRTALFRPAPYLCVLPRNESPFPTSFTTHFTILFRNSQLPAHTVTCRALQHSLGAVRRCCFTSLNLHRARVRRNRGRLPSSRCIESARTHRARACALPLRASDTTLGLLDSSEGTTSEGGIDR